MQRSSLEDRLLEMKKDRNLKSNFLNFYKMNVYKSNQEYPLIRMLFGHLSMVLGDKHSSLQLLSMSAKKKHIPIDLTAKDEATVKICWTLAKV